MNSKWMYLPVGKSVGETDGMEVNVGGFVGALGSIRSSVIIVKTSFRVSRESTATLHL